jgi:hypothetical protein
MFGVAMVIAAWAVGARAEPLALAPAGNFLASIGLATGESSG